MLAQAALVAVEGLVRVTRGQVLEDGWRVDDPQAEELAARLRVLGSEIVAAKVRASVCRGPLRDELDVTGNYDIQALWYRYRLATSYCERRCMVWSEL